MYAHDKEIPSLVKPTTLALELCKLVMRMRLVDQ
jgi:hypothetical protein